MPDAATLQQALIEELKRRKCIRTAAVEAAFRAVPRHLFVPGVPLADVYRDVAIPTKRGADGGFVSSSSQPAIMALMLEQLSLRPGHQVLEIGAGTGYNAALMAHIVGASGRVVSVDIDEDIASAAREHLMAAGFDDDVVCVVTGDGGLGHAEAAPYDRIVLAVGSSDITPAWREQLRPAGRLLLPLSIKGPQMCVAFERANAHLESVSIEDCGFMMLRGAFAGPGARLHIGEIRIAVADLAALDAGAITDWLKRPSRVRPTGVLVREIEAFGSLSHWLAIREPGYCSVSVVGEAADRAVIPDLFEWPETSTVKVAHTVGVIGDRGLCVLMRQPGTQTEQASAVARNPFEVHLRTFGPDDAIADRVVDHIQAWDAARRPSREGLRIRVYPREAGYHSAAGEVVIDKRWSRLVLDWR